MNSALISSFEAEKNRKAFTYTAIVCAVILLIAIFYTWPLQITPISKVQDLIEINLGNEKEGMGVVQPLVKGAPAPEKQNLPSVDKTVSKTEAPARDLTTDEKDPEAASLTKPVKQNEAAKLPSETPVKQKKATLAVPVINPNPTPPKPKIPLYKGGAGPGGNGATQDNGYKNQGYKPGNGDAGNPNGKPDSYGKDPGGRVGGGPLVTSGDRKIIRYYAFTASLDKATIYATIKVSTEGKGTYIGFARNSSTTSQAYANEIINHLSSIQFDKSDHESTVVVKFNFSVQ